MSHPYVFDDIKPQKPKYVFDDITPSNIKPGMLSYLANFGRNAPDYISQYMQSSTNPVASFLGNILVKGRELEGLTNPTIEQQVQEKINAARQTIEPSKEIFKHDMQHMFDNFGSVLTDNDLSTMDKLKGVAGAIPQMLIDLPKMATTPIEASLGIGITQQGAPVFTPEERAEKQKEAAGVLLSTALGMGSRLAIEGAFAAKAAGAVKAVEAGLAPTKMMGNVARKLITGTTEGAVAGTSYGAIGRANESDQLSAILMGLSFAPVGAAFELLGKSHLDEKMGAADRLFMTRQIQFNPETVSLAKQTNLFENIATHETITTALGDANADLAKSHFVLQGIDPKDFGTLRQNLNGYYTVGYVRPDGNMDMFAAGADSPLANSKFRNTFNASGYIPGEVVSFNGKDYKFDSVISERLKEYGLRDLTTGQEKIAYAHEIKRNTEFNIDNPALSFESNLSLKGKWIQAAKAGNPRIFESTNKAAIDNAQTGQPLKVIGFRQQRGPEQALDTGRFWAITDAHASEYNPVSYIGLDAAGVKASKASGQGYHVWTSSGIKTNFLGKMGYVGRKVEDNIAHSLLVHNLTFEKPFIFDGKHKEIWETVKGNTVTNALLGSEEKIAVTFDTYDKYKASTPINPISETQWQRAKKLVGSKNDIGLMFTPQEKSAFNKFGEMIYGNMSGKTHPETGYQGMDRILKKVMTRNGYDGLVMKSGHNIHGTEVIDYRLKSFYEKHPTTDVGYRANVINAEHFTDLMYKGFKKQLFQDTQVTPFNELFDKFATSKGFTDSEKPSLKLSFEKRLAQDLHNELPPVEKSIVKRVQDEIDNVKKDAFENLRHNVHTNGMHFDTGDNGVIKIRDTQTNALLHSSQSIEEASEFVNKSGQMNTFDIDGNGTVPPKLIFGNIPPAGGPNPFHTGVIPDLPTKAEQFISNIEPTWLTRNRENFRNLDVIHGLNGAMLKIQDMLDSGRRLKIANENPYLKRLQDIHNSLGGSADMDKKIPIWMEMRTSKERIAGGARGGRAMNPDEVNLAHTLAGPASNPVDIDKLYKVVEFRRKLQKDGLNGKLLSKDERKIQYEAYKKQLGFKPEEETALTALLTARRLPLDQLETGASVRLAETLQAERQGFITDRNVYAQKHFNSTQLKAAQEAEQLYKDLATRFGISSDTLLQGYFPHARTKFDGNLSRTLNEFKLGPKEKEFFARMVRTGEIRPYDDGLTAATQRYISGGFNEMYMKQNVNTAIESFKNDVLPKITDPAHRKNAIAIFNSYKDSLMGKPHHLDRVANDSFRSMLGTLGVEIAPDSKILQNIINAGMMSITTATQGLRPALALRDFYSNMRTYAVKMMSVQKAAEVIKYGFSMEDAVVRKTLMESGEVAHYGILQFGGIETESAIRNISNKIGRKLSDVETGMIKYGGQPTVYERITAGITIERKKAVMEGAREYLGKLQSKEALQKVYKDLRLDSYDFGVQQNFDKLFQDGRYDEASKFLARQTVAETAGWYGQGNHPKGWNTYLGRVAGQFGNWSINYRDTVLRAAATGPMKDRITRLGIMAAFDGALTLAAAKGGISFTNWMTLPAMTFMGGPSLDYIQAVNNSIFGFGQDKQVAQSKMKRLLPYNSDRDEWHLNQFYIPGGYFANDIAKAMEVSEDMGTTWGVLRGLGLHVEDAYYKPGMVENYMKQNVVEPIEY